MVTKLNDSDVSCSQEEAELLSSESKTCESLSTENTNSGKDKKVVILFGVRREILAKLTFFFLLCAVLRKCRWYLIVLFELDFARQSSSGIQLKIIQTS